MEIRRTARRPAVRRLQAGSRPAVRAWYAAQNEVQLLGSMSELQHALRDVPQLGWMLDPEMLEQGFNRNAGFIRDVIGQAKDAQRAASTPAQRPRLGTTR
ncbi:hypothetical protein [Ralstonia syzygii]|uniref:hypothetical protein n=1 Tax=Ralstonia syzygii TaxID=28097 RepID=UPI001E4EC73C|nr:hypothetical protein [Ralstonia syzygii]